MKTLYTVESLTGGTSQQATRAGRVQYSSTGLIRDPSTEAPTPAGLCTSAQRSCIRSALSRVGDVVCNVITIIVSKMTSHSLGTVQMREVRKRDNKVRRGVI